MAMITSREILDRCGFKTPKTLSRWAARQLIPPPSIQTHPNGRGKIAYWPEWVLRRIQEVQNRIARGESLDRIAKELGNDWQAEEDRLTRRRPDARAMFASNITRDLAIDEFSGYAYEAILAFFEGLGMRRPANSTDLLRAFAASTLIDRALELIRDGYSPVVVIVGKEFKVVPDFLVSSALAHPNASDHPVLVLPVRDLLTIAFDVEEPTLPKLPKRGPVLEFVDRSAKKSRQRKYHHKGQWGFELED